MPERVEVFRTSAGKWDWRKITRNENVVATSGSQGYENKLDAIKMAKQENEGVPVFVVEVRDAEPAA